MKNALFCLVLAMPVLAPAQSFDSLEYRNVGPNRGGRVTAVAGTAAAPGTFFLGASGGGVWKTEDYGVHWRPVSDGYFATPSTGDIAIAANDANVVYVGTGTDGLRSNIIAGRGMYKSVDGGDTWTHIGLDDSGHIGAVEIDPRNHNVVWVAAIGQAFAPNEERGVYKTSNGGRSWTKVLNHSEHVGFSDIELLPGNADIAFATAWKAERKPWTIISGGAADEGGLYKTYDGGENWTRIEDGLPGDLIGKIDLAISPSDSSIVYALVEAPGDEGGLYRSDNQGGSFTRVSNDDAIRTRPFYYTNVEVDPKDPDTVYVMATDFLRSTDGGKTWEERPTPHADNHDMWINPSNPDLFIQGNDGGANVTHNGGDSWSTQFNQSTAEIYQVEPDDRYPYWLYGGQQDNSSTIAVPSMAPYDVQHPAAWIVTTGGCETGPAVPKPGDPDIVYANCKGRFGVYNKRTGTEKSYYVGAANMYGQNPRDLRYRFQRVAPILVSPHDNNVIYHASQYVHRTRDEGRTWERISPDLTAFAEDKQVISGSPITRDITGEEFYSTIYSLRESPVEPGIIWAGANDGPVHVTRDGGESWQNVTPSRLPAGGRVDAIEPSPHEAGTAYIAVVRQQLGDAGPHLYKTDNFGRSWDRLTDGDNGIPSDYPTRVVREDPLRRGLLYAGTEYGMFVSFDDGDNWQPFQQNLPVTPVTDLRVHRGDLVLSTMGRGFWVLDNITTLRQSAFGRRGNDVILFRPKDTHRFRHGYEQDDAPAVPDYPVPAVAVDYYLPTDVTGPVRLEVRDADGTIVNVFRSDDTVSSATPDDGEDMGSGEALPPATATLTVNPGMNRFRWDMRHRGPWHEEEDRRFRGGPLAAPGLYTLELTAGQAKVAEEVALLADPRALDAGTTLADIDAQVVLQLDIVGLMNDARNLVRRLDKEAKALRERGPDVSSQQAARLESINDTLAQLQADDDVVYAEPKLTEQMEYLLFMLNGADQAPGRDAYERYNELRTRFHHVRALSSD